MPLPSEGAWPPPSYKGHYDDQREASAWYSGDPQTLAKFYAGGESVRPSDRTRFWRRQQNVAVARDRSRVHVPAAGDIAATSADLLFGEAPEIRIEEAHESTDANASATKATAIATQDRLDQLGDELHLVRLLLEGAEIGAGIGGVYLRVGWDKELDPDRPILDIVHGDRAVPEFTRGRLSAVTFWSVLSSTDTTTIRHLERHERGVVLHGLYAGNSQLLGVRIPLTSDPRTRDLPEEVPLPDGVRSLVRYVPNQLPNRKRRGEPIGRADTAGAESLMDSLDETFTSWIRDIRLGQSRIIVPNAWLSRVERGSGATFDVDREVFTGLEVDPLSQQDGGKILTPVEFKLRTTEHAETALALFERIVTTSGYSPQSFGLHSSERGDMTATEVRSKESRSLATKARKERYWQPALEEILEVLLQVDKAEFGGKAEPMRPTVKFQDGIVEDPQRTATTIDLLNRAQAISTETRVRMAQPDWSDDEVALEVQRITEEQGLAVPDPTGGMP